MTIGTLVDATVPLDVFTEDPVWADWSADAAEADPLVIDPIIYAEISVRFTRIEDLEAALSPDDFRRKQLPWSAGFLAGKAFLAYRRGGGTKRSPLPDFTIGAHAAVSDLNLLTRDASRYRTYFPRANLIAPDDRLG